MKIHLLPGDAYTETFKNSRIEGEVIICRECLIEGDVKAEKLADFWRLRAEFIENEYADGESSYHQTVAAEFEKLAAAARDGSEINLWFEYELFCQVNMWFTLALLSDENAEIYRVAPVTRGEDEIWKGFGRLSEADFRTCFEKRTKFEDSDIQLGKNLWAAYQNKDFGKLSELSRTESARFPKLREVCEAEIGKQTRPVNTLQKIVATGETDFGRIFRSFVEAEGVYGFGDSQVKRILREI